ncbi:hypothetical protein T10_9888 [Trichinella papuae]|uniref:Uncharacterized protein n=1 Tax=Trichinella papuae TaxID=268474 RepID=A0A0V1M566_9BILA|nr:hypothetical protein T10_9888 [Trichinella papuae]
MTSRNAVSFGHSMLQMFENRCSLTSGSMSNKNHMRLHNGKSAYLVTILSYTNKDAKLLEKTPSIITGECITVHHILTTVSLLHASTIWLPLDNQIYTDMTIHYYVVSALNTSGPCMPNH